MSAVEHAAAGPSDVRQLLTMVHLEVQLARRLAPLRAAMAFLPLIMMIFLFNAVQFLVRSDGYLSSNGTEHGIAGMTVLFCFVNLPFFSWSAYDEHGFGTWDRLRSGFARPSVVLGAKVLFMAAYLAVMFVVSYLGGLALGMNINGSVLAWAAIAVLTSIVAATYALMLYVLLPTGNLFIILSHAGCLVMGGFAGALVPFRLLPAWVRTIAPVLPQYWAVRAFRGVSLDGEGFSGVIGEMSMLVGFAMLFMMIAIWRFDPAAEKRPISE